MYIGATPAIGEATPLGSAYVSTESKPQDFAETTAFMVYEWEWFTTSFWDHTRPRKLCPTTMERSTMFNG